MMELPPFIAEVKPSPLVEEIPPIEHAEGDYVELNRIIFDVNKIAFDIEKRIALRLGLDSLTGS